MWPGRAALNSTLSVRNVSIELLTIPISDIESIDQLEEFDPGSERTLAAWLRHASRGVKMIRSNTVKHDRRKGE